MINLSKKGKCDWCPNKATRIAAITGRIVRACDEHSAELDVLLDFEELPATLKYNKGGE